MDCPPRGRDGRSMRERKLWEQEVYVGNLPHNITKEHIKRLFAKYSPMQVERVQRGMKCFAFLDLGDSETVSVAIRDLNNSTYEGRRLVVRCVKQHLATVEEYEGEDAQCEEASAEMEAESIIERSDPGHGREKADCRRRSSRIYVGNLPRNITKDQIGHLFLKYSPKQLERVQTGMKCFAFLDLGDSETVSLAIRELNNSTYKGRRLVVSEMKRNSTADGFKTFAEECQYESLQCEEAATELEDSKEGIEQGPSLSQAMDSAVKYGRGQDPSPSHGTGCAGDMSDAFLLSNQCLQCVAVSRSQEELSLKSTLIQQSRNLKLEEMKLLLEIEKLQLEIKKLTRENSFFTCKT